MSTNILQYKVRFGDTDAAGIVYYPNFYKWMDTATHEILESKGFGIFEIINGEKISWPLLETHCQFHSPLVYRDVIEIHAQVTEIKNKIFKVSHTFKKGDITVAEGYELRAWASFSGDKPKAVPIPEDIKLKLM